MPVKALARSPPRATMAYPSLLARAVQESWLFGLSLRLLPLPSSLSLVLPFCTPLAFFRCGVVVTTPVDPSQEGGVIAFPSSSAARTPSRRGRSSDIPRRPSKARHRIAGGGTLSERKVIFVKSLGSLLFGGGSPRRYRTEVMENAAGVSRGEGLDAPRDGCGAWAWARASTRPGQVAYDNAACSEGP